MADLQAHFDPEGRQFEARGAGNGERYWFAREFATLLGYDNFESFRRRAINRAISTCANLGVPVEENFERLSPPRRPGSPPRLDYKLSRFACYLIAMNGDPSKPNVAKAQGYFARLAEATSQFMQQAAQKVADVERVQIRDEVSDRVKSLRGVAKQAGVQDHGLFQNAGYRGMYNMDLGRLKDYKGLPEGAPSLLDFMGRRELAANLFRLTETEARLRTDEVAGQRPAENAAFQVGLRVRTMMRESDGSAPEDLSLQGDIREIRQALKKTERELARLDKPATAAARKGRRRAPARRSP